MTVIEQAAIQKTLVHEIWHHLSVQPRQPASWHILHGLRFKPYGSVCVRSDGRITGGGDQGYKVRSQRGKAELTLAFLGATGKWTKNLNDREFADILPENAAEERKITFTETGCEFDIDRWCQGSKAFTSTEEITRKSLLRWGADGIILSLDSGLDDVQ